MAVFVLYETRGHWRQIAAEITDFTAILSRIKPKIPVWIKKQERGEWRKINASGQWMYQRQTDFFEKKVEKQKECGRIKKKHRKIGGCTVPMSD